MPPGKKVRVLVIPLDDYPYTIDLNDDNALLASIGRLIGEADIQVEVTYASAGVLFFTDENAMNKRNPETNVPAWLTARAFKVDAFAIFGNMVVASRDNAEVRDVPDSVILYVRKVLRVDSIEHKESDK